MNWFGRIAAALLSAFFLLHIPVEKLAAAEAHAAQTETMTPQRGTLYRIKSKAGAMYLFGTLHVGIANFLPLDRSAMQALKDADRLVLEIDLRDRQGFATALDKRGMLPAGETLERRLSPAALGRLRTTLAEFGLSRNSVSRMKPWMAANVLISADLERHGYRHAYGIDAFLLEAAGDRTTVIELESVDYQLSLFDGMPAADQERYLVETLERIENGEGIAQARQLINAWAAADSAAIAGLLRAMQEDDSVSSAFLQKELLDRRNPDMAEKLDELLKKEGTTFVGVGMLHLVGERSLPALLRSRGHAVDKLY